MADALSMATFWHNGKNWKKSGANTFWCLVGCSIGDFGTILFFQLNQIPFPILGIFILAIVNGILTSIMLETLILSRQMALRLALKTACGMALISMIAMETSMNLVDYMITGGAVLNVWVVPLALLAGFLTPLPYNYWRLEHLGKACH